GCAQAPEEHQDHQAGKKKPDAAFMQKSLDRGADETGLVEHDIGLHCRGNVDEVGYRISDSVDYRDRVRIAALLHHRQIDRTLAVHMDGVVLERVRILELPDVGHQHRVCAVHFDRILAGVLEIELGVRVDVVVQIPDLHVTGGKDYVRLTQAPHNVHRADLSRLQLGG